MARPSEERSKKLSLRLTLSEYEEIKSNAAIAGVGISSYIRKRVLGYKIKSKLSLTMIAELRRIGGLLKLVHLESRNAYDDRTLEALKDLQAYVKKLSTEQE